MAKIVGYVNLYDSPSLGGLSKNRTPASTSFVGRYALIDIALSNFANANINDINILVKDNFRSVAKHCGSLKNWASNTKIGKQNYLINEKGLANPDFNSDLNALRENDWVLFDTNADYIVIQPAHILTRIDISDFVRAHQKSGAAITMAYTKIKDGDKAFLTSTILGLDGDKVVSSINNDGSKKEVNVSLRTYVFSRECFERMLRHKDYRKALSLRALLSHIVNEHSEDVRGYEYEGYARCFDSLEHFVEYSFELFDPKIAKSLFAKGGVAYTISRNTPPASYGEHADVKESFIANGVQVDGKVEHSILSRYVKVEEGASIKNSIILTRCVIKKGAVIENAVIDKYSTISGVVKGSESKILFVEQGSKK